MGYGVDARLVMDPDRPTGTCVVMVTHKGDHTMMSDPGANAALHPDDLPKDLFAPGAHLHMSGYTLLNEGSRAPPWPPSPTRGGPALLFPWTAPPRRRWSGWEPSRSSR